MVARSQSCCLKRLALRRPQIGTTRSQRDLEATIAASRDLFDRTAAEERLSTPQSEAGKSIWLQVTRSRLNNVDTTCAILSTPPSQVGGWLAIDKTTSTWSNSAQIGATSHAMLPISHIVVSATSRKNEW